MTIYNQGFAIVKQRRMLALEEGVSDVKFPDVAATIVPESVRFQALSPTPATVLEQNFEFDLVNANKLLDKYIDHAISIVGRDGDVIDGRLLASDEGGIILSNESGIQLISRETNVKDIRFSKLPDGLLTRPTLVWKVRSEGGGEQLVDVTYQAVGLDWRVDYRAVVGPDEKTLDLHGWVTVNNRCGTTFRDARLKLMAGDVNVALGEKGAKDDPQVFSFFFGVGKKGITEQTFSEYHLYTLEHSTTLANSQTKQIKLLSIEKIPVTKSYVYRSGFGNRVAARLQFQNSSETANGLGIPLPKGPLRVFLTGSDAERGFLATEQLDHTPKNEPVKAQIGFAFDITAERTLKADRHRAGVKWNQQQWEIAFRNHKSRAVPLHVEESLARNRNWKLRDVSHKYRQQDAQTITFDVELPANGQAVISYTVEYTW